MRVSKNPRTGAATAAIPEGGALGNGLTGSDRVAASINRRQVSAGNEPPVTLFIGALSSLPSHTPATRSAV